MRWVLDEPQASFLAELLALTGLGAGDWVADAIALTVADTGLAAGFAATL